MRRDRKFPGAESRKDCIPLTRGKLSAISQKTKQSSSHGWRRQRVLCPLVRYLCRIKHDDN
jgi:hypothetical protein